MKKTERRLIGIVTAVLMASTLFLMSSATANAQEIRNIRITGGISGTQLKELRVEPQTLIAQKNTVVVWSSFARGTEVKVIFEEGKTCSDVTDGKTGFSLNAKSCFVTSWISQGGTSSLQFKQAGTYKYIVEASADASVKVRGEIVVLSKSVSSTWPE